MANKSNGSTRISLTYKELQVMLGLTWDSLNSRPTPDEVDETLGTLFVKVGKAIRRLKPTTEA